MIFCPSLVIETLPTLTKLPWYSSATIFRCRNGHPASLALNVFSTKSTSTLRPVATFVASLNSSRSSSANTISDNLNGAMSTVVLARFSRARSQLTPDSTSSTQAIAVNECIPASRKISEIDADSSPSAIIATGRPPIITPPTSAFTANRTAPGLRCTNWPLQTTKLESFDFCFGLISTGSGDHRSVSTSVVVSAARV